VTAGQVPTTELVGEGFPLEEVGEAFALVDRKIPGRDAIQVGLRLTSRPARSHVMSGVGSIVCPPRLPTP
jgi:hypothetical protein